MKKIILILAISLFGVTSAFSQWDDITVTWYINGACDCSESIDSVFKIKVEIYDIANNNTVVLDETNWESGATDFSDFNVDDIEYYCNVLNHEYTPDFTIYVSVEMYCENTSLTLECKGKATVLGKSCYDFANGLVNIPQIEVKP